jgi:hypothetical protein
LFLVVAKFDEFDGALLSSAVDSEKSLADFQQRSYSLLSYIYESHPRVVTDCPDIFNGIKSDREQVIALLEGGSLIRNGYFPVVRRGDCSNMRCIKFGGCIPHDPDEGYPLCAKCRLPVTHIATIYVKLLPDELQAWFPPDELDTLLVIAYCEDCFSEVPVFRYRKEEIDRLVWSANHSSNRRPFNEARVVVSWTKKAGLPSYTALQDAPAATQGLRLNHDLWMLWETFVECGKYSVLTGRYAGGWPYYIQDSEKPTSASRLLFEFDSSEASTGMWGDAGTAQLWMETGEEYGVFSVTWACH